MGVQTMGVYDSDGRLRRDFDMWFLYAAFTRPASASALVKVGITKTPLDRFFEIHSGSPFPVEVALWVDVGDSSKVRKLEAAVHRAFASRNTRGEWFQFDLSNEGDKAEFHSTLRKLFLEHTGRRLIWKKSTLSQIRAYAVTRSAARQIPYQRKRRRRSPWEGPS